MVTVFGAGMCACISLGRGALGGFWGLAGYSVPPPFAWFRSGGVEIVSEKPLDPTHHARWGRKPLKNATLWKLSIDARDWSAGADLGRETLRLAV